MNLQIALHAVPGIAEVLALATADSETQNLLKMYGVCTFVYRETDHFLWLCVSFRSIKLCKGWQNYILGFI